MKPLRLLSLLILCCLSCTGEKVPQVVREDLFILEIGMLEDQIALFDLDGRRGANASIAMREGLFYISSGGGGKVSRYSSYGDLIFMIYNEETNPPPLTLRSNIGEDEVVTRWAFSWPLREPGRIAVDSRKHIYVEDTLPYERHGFDAEKKALLDRMILHFDDTGRFIEYLGQEGVGGTPFPRISGIYTSLQDELAVVCRLPEGWMIYWFDSAANPLFVIPLPDSGVPVPEDRSGVFSSVDAIMAAPDARRLFMKVDYYRVLNDEGTATRAGVAPDSSVVWILNAETGVYSGMMEAPFYEHAGQSGGPGRREMERLFYSMLGVMRGGRVFLQVPVEGGYSVLILEAGGAGEDAGARRQGIIRVDEDELEFNTFNLSGDGILSGLLATAYEARMVWWRTDRLIAGLLR
ncbi:MAG: hypothetical protein LBQ35_05905 [Spirochaetaceae bacterium]|jgi:hypothetical protein|nr:hypothetical protein [Spirochaetaceae bacterium]